MSPRQSPRHPDGSLDESALPRRDKAMLEAAAWLQAHPANAPGTDKTFVVRAQRRLQRLLGGLPTGPPGSEDPPDEDDLRRCYGRDVS